MDNKAVKQSLLFAQTPAGPRYTLAVLEDDRLAILRDGVIVEVAERGQDATISAVDRFVELTELQSLP